MHIISKELWSDKDAEMPEENKKIVKICAAINDCLIQHPNSDFSLDEEIEIELSDAEWPTVDEFATINELVVNEAGFQYLSLMRVAPNKVVLRIGVNTEFLANSETRTFREMRNILINKI